MSDEQNFDRFLEFARHRREKQKVVVVSTAQLAEMLGVIHAENMEAMYYSMRMCGINEKDWRLKEKYYRHELEKIFNEG